MRVQVGAQTRDQYKTVNNLIKKKIKHELKIAKSPVDTTGLLLPLVFGFATGHLSGGAKTAGFSNYLFILEMGAATLSSGGHRSTSRQVLQRQRQQTLEDPITQRGIGQQDCL